MSCYSLQQPSCTISLLLFFFCIAADYVIPVFFFFSHVRYCFFFLALKKKSGVMLLLPALFFYCRATIALMCKDAVFFFFTRSFFLRIPKLDSIFNDSGDVAYSNGFTLSTCIHVHRCMYASLHICAYTHTAGKKCFLVKI